MGYIDDNLLPGESVVYRTKLHWVVFLRSALLVVLGGLFLAGGDTETGGGAVLSVLGTFFLLVGFGDGTVAYVKYATSEFGVTNKRVIMKTGWLRRRSLETLMGKVEAISIDQGLLGRILDFGTVVITGTGGSREPFRGVSFPLELRRRITEQIGTRA